MKNIFFACLFIFILPVNLFGQSALNFKEKLNLPFGGLPYKIRQCNDGGFVTLFVKNGTYDGCTIAKLNPDGTIKWSKEFDIPFYCGDFAADSLNNIYMTSSGPSSADSAGDIIIVKVDPLGTILWSKSYGNSVVEGNVIIDYSTDGSLYFASWMNVPYSSGIHLFKIEMNGNLIWDRIIKDALLNSGCVDIKIITPDHIAIVGDIAVSSGSESLNLIFNKNGNLLSSIKIDYPIPFRLTNIQSYKNKGSILSGSVNFPSQSPLIAAFDSSNNFLWAKIYHSTDPKYNTAIYDLIKLNDNSYVVSYSNYEDSISSACAVMHIDSTGNSDWARSYENKSIGFLNSIDRTTDKGFITAGSFIQNSNDQVLIIKADSLGKINTCSEDSVFQLLSENINLTITPYAILDSGCLTGNALYYWNDYLLSDSLICKDNLAGGTSSITIIVPDVFTPNNDGVNDIIDFSGLNLTESAIAIYNRWGEKVFETSQNVSIWDGKNLKGIDCTDGVYYYILQSTGITSVKYDQKGFIQLIR
ncbi:MAG: gliding motility-associated C-terminal domain-containing protein [Bacteroidia bacterium]